MDAGMPGPEQRRQRQPQLVLDDQTNDPQGGSAQGEGVLAAGRLLVDGEHADQAVELVGQGDAEADRRRGAAVVRSLGRIVLGDGLRHLGLLAVGQSVVAAHDTLQLGKLAHHAGDEIGLAEPCGGAHAVQVCARHGLGDLHGQRGDAVDLVLDRPEPRMEDDGAQGGDTALQALLAVLIPEELGVGQTGAQNPLVALHDVLTPQRAFGRRHVGRQQEAGRQRSVRLDQGEVLLMAAHGGREHLVRQLHEARFDAAHQRLRPLHESGHLLDQGRILLDRQSGGVRERRGLFDQDLAPLAAVDTHEGPLQPLPVVGPAFDPDVLGRQERMAARPVGEGQLPVAQVQRALQPDAVEDRQHGVQRANPAEIGFRPAHGGRPDQGADRLGQQLGQDRGRGLSRDLPHGEEEFALGRLAQLRLVGGGEAVGLQKARDGRLRRAALRALALLGPVGLLERQSLNHQHETTRGRGGEGMVEGQAGGAQSVADQRAQVFRRLHLHAGGDLLRAQLQKQLRHRPSPQPQAAALRRTRQRRRPRSRSSPWPGRARGRCRPAAR